MMSDNIIVRLVSLPDKVYGFTTPSPDGYMNVYINAKMAQEQQEQVLDHEIGHIERDDFGCELELARVEVC